MHSCLLDVSVIHTRDYLLQRSWIHGRMGHSRQRSLSSQQIGSEWGRGGIMQTSRDAPGFDYC